MPPETGGYGVGTDSLAILAGEVPLPEGFGPVLIAAAHPDDEVCGAGGRFPLLRDLLWFVHVTDGSPNNLRDAHAAGFATRGEYARARRVELFEALALGGIGPERCRFLDVPDQEASFHLAGITRSLVEILALMKPSLVLAPPYEGGHPDHDAVAFAVNVAVRLNTRRGAPPIPVAEYAMYHVGKSGWAIYEFLSSWEYPERTVVLTDEERELKSKMMRCFRSQRNVLAAFPDNFERFRMAPDYDFTRPPHEGALLYERYDWGISGERWRAWVKWALTELGEGK